ncbi:MAG: L-seryl-tRNA(Sec) selenium transferase [Pyrinomonadaceae bacterium]
MDDTSFAMRVIPSVDEVLRSTVGMELVKTVGRDQALRAVRDCTVRIREHLSANSEATRTEIVAMIDEMLLSVNEQFDRNRLRRVINATGVVIHTNLGRSPLSAAAVAAFCREASDYCNVEFDLNTGERGRRGASAEKLLAVLTGAEEGLIVNNCAAAALLVLSAIAKGGEVIVSRGELVEIGGDFRIPDVLEQSGCRLREVGTTNRTKLSDYERAITEETKAILRVHPSNYRITGFTESASLNELADLAHRNGLIMFEDAGSGALTGLSMFGLGDEPVIKDSISLGADIVVFSGDKLCGGVQAGLIVGSSELIERVKRHPLYRAVRADKLCYAAVEATLMSFSRGTAFEDVPTLKMLSSSYEGIAKRAGDLVSKLNELRIGSLSFEMIDGTSAVGGGAGTNVELKTRLISITHKQLSAKEIAAAFRNFDVPIVARIAEEKVLLDLRTVSENDEMVIENCLKNLSKTNGSGSKIPT